NPVERKLLVGSNPTWPTNTATPSAGRADRRALVRVSVRDLVSAVRRRGKEPRAAAPRSSPHAHDSPPVLPARIPVAEEVQARRRRLPVRRPAVPLHHLGSR